MGRWPPGGTSTAGLECVFVQLILLVDEHSQTTLDQGFVQRMRSLAGAGGGCANEHDDDVLSLSSSWLFVFSSLPFSPLVWKQQFVSDGQFTNVQELRFSQKRFDLSCCFK